jgi:hypothetical protein
MREATEAEKNLADRISNRIISVLYGNKKRRDKYQDLSKTELYAIMLDEITSNEL